MIYATVHTAVPIHFTKKEGKKMLFTELCA